MGKNNVLLGLGIAVLVCLALFIAVDLIPEPQVPEAPEPELVLAPLEFSFGEVEVEQTRVAKTQFTVPEDVLQLWVDGLGPDASPEEQQERWQALQVHHHDLINEYPEDAGIKKELYLRLLDNSTAEDDYFFVAVKQK